jgi:hypothetical protein
LRLSLNLFGSQYHRVIQFLSYPRYAFLQFPLLKDVPHLWHSAKSLFTRVCALTDQRLTIINIIYQKTE